LPDPDYVAEQKELVVSPVNFAISAIKGHPVSNSLSVGFASFTKRVDAV
jgi:hypothetical protein